MKIYKYIALLAVPALVYMAWLGASTLAQDRPVRVSESERLVLYAKILERDNLILQIQPLERQLQLRTAELDILMSDLFDEYEMDRLKYQLNFLTGEFSPIPPDQSPNVPPTATPNVPPTGPAPSE